MEEKRGRGRPEGREYPYARTIRFKNAHIEAAGWLAIRWGCSVAEAIRRSIIEQARKEKAG